jgi:hypothetical protein
MAQRRTHNEASNRAAISAWVSQTVQSNGPKPDRRAPVLGALKVQSAVGLSDVPGNAPDLSLGSSASRKAIRVSD